MCNLENPALGSRISSYVTFLISIFFEEKKNNKNAMSRKAKGLEQSYLDIRIASPECTLIAPHYRVEKFKIAFFISKLFEKKNEKKKTPFLQNHKDLSTHTWTADLQFLSLR